MVKQLAQDVLQEIFSEMTTANYGAPVIAALAPAAFDYKKLLAIREACSAVKMPVTDRALILDGTYYTNLLGDDVVAKGFVPQVAQPGIVEAQIHRLACFDLHETVIRPENGEKLIGFAAHPSGLAVAMRYLVPAAHKDYDEPIASLKMETDVNEIVLLEAAAIVAMVDTKLHDPLHVSLGPLGPDGLQRLFTTSGVLTAEMVRELLN